MKIIILLSFCLLGFPLLAFAESEPSFPLSAAELGDAGPFVPVKYGNGVEFYNKEANFLMNLRFRMQNLAEFKHSDNVPAGQESGEFSWYVRRLRLRMNGHAYSPRLRYLIQLSFSRRDQDWSDSRFPNVIRDAMITYQLSDSWGVGFGQGKLPGNRQRVISSGDQQFTDRSIVNSAFTFDRDFGFQLKFHREHFNWGLAIATGEGRNQSVAPDQKLSYINRFEWLPLGSFKRNGDYFESDLAFETDFKASLGYSIGFLDGSARNNGAIGDIFTTTGNTGDPLVRRSQWVHYTDVLFKWQGYSFYGEWALREVKDPIINASQAFLVGQGYTAQLGRMIGEVDELALRHSAVLPGDDVLAYHQDRKVWSLVYNRFLRGHRIKLQAELGRFEINDSYMRLQMELGI